MGKDTHALKGKCKLQKVENIRNTLKLLSRSLLCLIECLRILEFYVISVLVNPEDLLSLELLFVFNLG